MNANDLSVGRNDRSNRIQRCSIREFRQSSEYRYEKSCEIPKCRSTGKCSSCARWCVVVVAVRRSIHCAWTSSIIDQHRLVQMQWKMRDREAHTHTHTLESLIMIREWRTSSSLEKDSAHLYPGDCCACYCACARDLFRHTKFDSYDSRSWSDRSSSDW